MRLTVGPLPSAVYWRRRAIVLGALFIVLLVLFTTCRGGGGSGASPTGATSSPTVDAADPSSTPDVEQSPTAPPSQAPTSAPVVPPPAVTSAPPVQAPSKGDCTDAEIKVTPVPDLTEAPNGQTIVIKLRIRNISDRECSRDVGADAQEIYIKRGAETVWSSDKCSTIRGSNSQPFPVDHEKEFRATWNGRQSTSCQNGDATGAAPGPGNYEVFARLGSYRSAPVKLKLT